MNFSGIQGFLFDLDDTLYPQMEYTRQCVMGTIEYLSRVFGRPRSQIRASLMAVLEENGIEQRQLFNEALKRLGLELDDRHLKASLKLFWRVKPKIKLYPGAVEMFSSIRRKGFKLGMVTDGHVDVQKSKIRTLKIRKYFQSIILSDEYGVEFRKPSTVPLMAALAELRLEPKSSVYVGNDPRKDFVGSRSLGMRTIRIVQGDYRNLSLEAEMEADVKVSNIRQLIDLIGGENERQ